MAALQATARSGAVALVAATAKTVLQITAPANHRVRVLGYEVSVDGATSTAVPVSVRILRQTTAGTGTSVTPVPVDKSVTETIQTTSAKDFSAEPTAGDVIDDRYEPAYGGQVEVMFPYGQEPVLQGGGRFGIEVTAPAGVNVKASIRFEE